MSKLFRPDNPVILFFERVFNMMLANILFLICSLPVFTIGASFTALCKIMQDAVMKSDNELGIIKRFFSVFRQNFKMATIAWLIILLLLCGFVYNMFLVAANFSGLGAKIVKILLLILILMVVGLASYLFPLIARYDNSLRKHYRNAMLLFVMAFPTTLVMILLNTLIFWIPYFSVRLFMRLFIVWMLLGFSVTCLADTVLLRPVFQKLEKAGSDPS